jgi:hypothetical protein
MDRRSKEAERRKRILDHAKTNRNVAKTCRYFGVARASFYLYGRLSRCKTILI